MAHKEIMPKENDDDFELLSIHCILTKPESGIDTSDTEDEVSKDKSIIPSFDSIAQEFVTVLQMLWKYMNEIGSVAEQTSLTNLISIPTLLRKIIKRQKEATDHENPIADVSFEMLLRDKSGQEKTETIKASIFEHKHLKAFNEFRQYHNAALRILNEMALQQIVNAYEKVLGDILAWHFYTNPDAAPKDKEISYSKLLSFKSIDEAKRHPHSRSKCNKNRSNLKWCFVAQAFSGPVINK